MNPFAGVLIQSRDIAVRIVGREDVFKAACFIIQDLVAGFSFLFTVDLNWPLINVPIANVSTLYTSEAVAGPAVKASAAIRERMVFLDCIFL